MDTKKLRQKILDLAIRGKLVPQDPNDEPASVLLERIREEKKQMVKDGKLKPKDIKNDTIIFKGEDNLHYEKFQDGTVKCIEDEIPFDVPDGWEWCRLECICPYGETETVDSSEIDDDSWILDLEDIEKETGRIVYFATKGEREAKSNKHRFFAGQLLYSKLRPYLNKVVIAPRDGFCTSEILPLKLYGSISPEYMQCFLMSDTFLAYVNLISYGLKMPRLGTNDGKNAVIALPPLEEQTRIVEKCHNAFEKIYTLQSDVDVLENVINLSKFKILDLAIQGKLVPQDLNDEPASVLLDRIRSEKEELIKQGKLKRDKKESIIYKGDDNSYYEKVNGTSVEINVYNDYELPIGWEFARLKTICSKIIDGAHNPPKGAMGITPYIMASSRNIADDTITDLENVRYLNEDSFIKENQRTNVSVNDILLTTVATLGRCSIYTGKPQNLTFQRSVSVITTLIDPVYLKVFFDSPLFQHLINVEATGTAQKGFYLNQLEDVIIPIPPLSEQQHITSLVRKYNTQFNAIKNCL
ncbi:MAG: restriction endonuclease subunit S [Lachnospiraceae bacterium]|nr:restriction endonuclease subunit S [Lachnospiraceae bacterium]